MNTTVFALALFLIKYNDGNFIITLSHKKMHACNQKER